MANRRRGRSRARNKRFSDHSSGRTASITKEQSETTATEPVAVPEDSPTTAG